MSGKTGLIVNPRSHSVARRGSVLEAAHVMLPGTHLLRLTEFGALPAGVARMAAAGVERIFVEGGDGTLHGVLSAALAPGAGFARPPAFGVLAGGSTNLAAKVLGLRATAPREICNRIRALEGGVTPAPQMQRALCVEGAAPGAPALGFLLSTGSLPRAMHYVQRAFHGPGRRGSGAVALAIARFVLAPYRYLDADGAPLMRASPLRVAQLALPPVHAFALMTSLPALSLGLNPFWGAGEGAVALTHVGWPIHALRRSILRILIGQGGPDLAPRGFTSHRGERFDLQGADSLMLDGEPLPTAPGGRVRVSATAPIGFLR